MFLICIEQNARLLSEEFSGHPRDAEIKNIYNAFMITSLWLLFAIGAHVTSVPYLIRVTYGITMGLMHITSQFFSSSAAYCMKSRLGGIA